MIDYINYDIKSCARLAQDALMNLILEVSHMNYFINLIKGVLFSSPVLMNTFVTCNKKIEWM